MRPVVVHMQVSLDQYVADTSGEPTWLRDAWSEDIDRYLTASFRDIDTMLMGRLNYEEQAAYWPTSDEPRAKIFNAHRKIVFSKSLQEVTWENARLATVPAAEEIAALQDGSDRPIGVSGGAAFIQSLLADHLIDELRLFVHPVLVGKGTPLFTRRQPLRLLEALPFAGGITLLRYQPVRPTD